MKVISIATSKKKGTRKTPVSSVKLIEDHGIEGDAHAGPWHRQVSLLAMEDIHGMQAKGIDVDFGDFAENIATSGIEHHAEKRCFRQSDSRRENILQR